MPVFTDDMTLADARNGLRELVDTGYRCPCCTQMAKVYKRKLHSAMAASLVVWYAKIGRQWGYAPDVLPKAASSQSDWSKLRYWGLIQSSEDRREDGGKAGVWRLTMAGALFARGEMRIESHARVYDGRCLGLVGDRITVRDALGDRFNYDELMAT